MIDGLQGDGNRGREYECPLASLYDCGRRARANLEDLGGSLRDLTTEMRQTLRDAFERHPYTSWGAGFAAGYVMGGGLPSRFTRLLFDLATRIAVARVAQQFSRGAFGSSSNGDSAATGTA